MTMEASQTWVSYCHYLGGYLNLLASLLDTTTLTTLHKPETSSALSARNTWKEMEIVILHASR